MKHRILLVAAPLLALTACNAEPNAEKAQTPAPAPSQTPPQAGPAHETGGPPPMGDPANNPDMTALAKEVDTDGNGELSRAEWRAKGLPESSFNMFEKGRGFVTLGDYQANAAPPGIDINGDGTLTIAEFIAFDRQMAAKMPPEAKADTAAAPKP